MKLQNLISSFPPMIRAGAEENFTEGMDLIIEWESETGTLSFMADEEKLYFYFKASPKNGAGELKAKGSYFLEQVGFEDFRYHFKILYPEFTL